MFGDLDCESREGPICDWINTYKKRDEITDEKNNNGRTNDPRIIIPSSDLYHQIIIHFRFDSISFQVERALTIALLDIYPTSNFQLHRCFIKSKTRVFTETAC